MITILIPLAGKSNFFKKSDYVFPTPLIEINDKPIIQHCIENYVSLKDKKFVFAVNQLDCEKFHLDNVLKLLTDHKCEVVKMPGETKGALCSCLVTLEHIDPDKELIIANGDQIISENINDIVNDFKKRNLDAGIITFNSVHPKWSYARINGDYVVETAEKKPLSKSAIAGFYYFKQAKYFFSAAMKTIENDDSIDGIFFTAPCLNQLILDNKNIGYYQIDGSNFHSFYSPEKIRDYKREKFNEHSPN